MLFLKCWLFCHSDRLNLARSLAEAQESSSVLQISFYRTKKKTVKRELCFGATSVHCIEKRFSGVVFSPLSQLKSTEISLDCPCCVEKNNTFTQIQHAVIIIFSSIILKTKRVKLFV